MDAAVAETAVPESAIPDSAGSARVRMRDWLLYRLRYSVAADADQTRDGDLRRAKRARPGEEWRVGVG